MDRDEALLSLYQELNRELNRREDRLAAMIKESKAERDEALRRFKSEIMDHTEHCQVSMEKRLDEMAAVVAPMNRLWGHTRWLAALVAALAAIGFWVADVWAGLLNLLRSTLGS